MADVGFTADKVAQDPFVASGLCIQPVDATLLPLTQCLVCCIHRLNTQPKADGHRANNNPAGTTRCQLSHRDIGSSVDAAHATARGDPWIEWSEVLLLACRIPTKGFPGCRIADVGISHDEGKFEHYCLG
jgi:hypothetical protein